jgi:hypothetical protein
VLAAGQVVHAAAVMSSTIVVAGDVGKIVKGTPWRRRCTYVVAPSEVHLRCINAKIC